MSVCIDDDNEPKIEPPELNGTYVPGDNSEQAQIDKDIDDVLDVLTTINLFAFCKFE